MDLTQIVTLITNVGFPIAVCLMLMWYIRELTSSHKDETEKFTNALNNNTLAIQQLVDKMSGKVE